MGYAFSFQAEDGIRDIGVTGVQTCALPICTVEVHVGLPGAGGSPIRTVGPTVEDHRRPARGARDLARDQAGESPRLFGHYHLEVLIRIHLRERLLDCVLRPSLAFGVELVQQRGYAQRLPAVVCQEQLERRPWVLYPPY